MNDIITFKGLKHYPLGNALLHPGTNDLTISNLATPLDGITIETLKATFVDLRFNPILLERNADFGVTFNQTDNSNGFKTIAQWAIAQQVETSIACLMLNSRLEGEQIIVEGFNEGKRVFQRVYEQPGVPGYNWMIVGVFDQSRESTVLSGLDCGLEKERDASGKVTELTAIKSFRCNGTITPISGKRPANHTEDSDTARSFSVDSLRIMSTLYYPGGLPEEKEWYISQVIITGQGMPALILTNEYTSRQ